jgi:hypothetical protein
LVWNIFITGYVNAGHIKTGDISGSNITIYGDISCSKITTTSDVISYGKGSFNNVTVGSNFTISNDGNIKVKNIECSETVKSGSFQSTSDYRIKSNVINLDHTYNVSKLNPVFYKNVLSNKFDIYPVTKGIFHIL